MPWTPIPSSVCPRYAGRTLPEVILALEDPDFLFCGLEQGIFSGPLLDEALDLAQKASRICLPRDDPTAVTFYYRHPGSESFGGTVVVSAKEAPSYAPYAVARSQGLDLGMPRRVAPRDPRAGAIMVTGLKLAVWGDLRPDLTAEECAAFFEDERNFL